MARYFRVQPAGLGLAGHYSECSDETLSDGVHVFFWPHEVLAPDAPFRVYGDEIVVIEADYHWSNGDVEGVNVDPDTATITARYTRDAFIAHFWPGGIEDGERPDLDNARSDWETA